MGRRLPIPIRAVTTHRTTTIAGSAAAAAVGVGLTLAALGAAEVSMQPEGMERVRISVLFIGIAVAAAIAAVVAAWAIRQARSVTRAMLFLTLMPVITTTAAVFVAAETMYLSSHDRDLVLIVLAFTLLLSIVFTRAISRPMVRDIKHLGEAAAIVSTGDLSARTGVVRDDELGSAASTFDDMVQQLDRARTEHESMEAERKIFIASVGHDLRTPVTAMRAAVEALRDGMAPDPDRYLRALESDLDALGGLIDDLFLYARLDAGGYHSGGERCDVAELVDDAAEALAPTADRQGITIERHVEAAAPVNGSPADLGRAIRNLLDNAVRHAGDSGSVEISVEATDEIVTVTVVDSGPGFPADFTAEALKPFTRADEARTRSDGGAGLGLAITSGIVSAHGGTTTVSAGPGGRVTVELPRAVRA